jgi:hypothetical protein
MLAKVCFFKGKATGGIYTKINKLTIHGVGRIPTSEQNGETERVQPALYVG